MSTLLKVLNEWKGDKIDTDELKWYLSKLIPMECKLCERRYNLDNIVFTSGGYVPVCSNWRCEYKKSECLDLSKDYLDGKITKDVLIEALNRN